MCSIFLQTDFAQHYWMLDKPLVQWDGESKPRKLGATQRRLSKTFMAKTSMSLIDDGLLLLCIVLSVALAES